jgi:hypothetical protein
MLRNKCAYTIIVATIVYATILLLDFVKNTNAKKPVFMLVLGRSLTDYEYVHWGMRRCSTNEIFSSTQFQAKIYRVKTRK